MLTSTQSDSHRCLTAQFLLFITMIALAFFYPLSSLAYYLLPSRSTNFHDLVYFLICGLELIPDIRQKHFAYYNRLSMPLGARGSQKGGRDMLMVTEAIEAEPVTSTVDSHYSSSEYRTVIDLVDAGYAIDSRKIRLQKKIPSREPLLSLRVNANFAPVVVAPILLPIYESQAHPRSRILCLRMPIPALPALSLLLFLLWDIFTLGQVAIPLRGFRLRLPSRHTYWPDIRFELSYLHLARVDMLATEYYLTKPVTATTSTDSRTAVTRLEKIARGDPTVDGASQEVREQWERRVAKGNLDLAITWVKGHKGVKGNTEADKAAKVGTALQCEDEIVTDFIFFISFIACRLIGYGDLST
ncbi:hypothetical protein BDZ91DRAFT_258936 [Kalaharituber pfeilii]|nr:hypothetical protein BDZ91DRAFT_258936 [Kalaharituber pfeilii]